jgi:hypothetical protein
MIRFGEPNPLNISNLRRVATHCPPHFEKVHITNILNEKNVTDWIWENLEGRFFYGNADVISQKSSSGYERVTLVGFEIPSEASMFALQYLITRNIGLHSV